MAIDEPKPFLVRLLLSLVGAYCAIAIAVVGIFLPFVLVANFGGGSSGAVGWGEALQGLGVFCAGFGVPSLIFAPDARRLKSALPVGALLLAAVIWPFATQSGDTWAVIVLFGLALLHGLVMFWSFGQLSGRAPPPEWKDLP